jgi:meiotic recombination protein SPO11
VRISSRSGVGTHFTESAGRGSSSFSNLFLLYQPLPNKYIEVKSDNQHLWIIIQRYPMDFDLFSNLLRDDPGPSSGSLLSNLPHRSPTDDSSISCNTSGHISNSQRNIANTPDPSQTGRVIAKIENIFESITDCILDQEKELVISLRSRPKYKPKDSEKSMSDPKPKPEIKNVTFPSKSPQETWKFSESKMIDRSHQLI